MEHGRIACRFNELSIDTPRNRYVLMALEFTYAAHRKQKMRQLADYRIVRASLRDLGTRMIRPNHERDQNEPER